MDTNVIKKNGHIKTKIVILVCFCLVILATAIGVDIIMGKSYFSEIKYKEVIEKIENDETFVLLISQTTCSHCISFKPKLKDTADEFEINIYYIDVDLLSDDEYDNLNSYINFSQSGTPLTVFIKDGEETTAASRINGDASKDKIEKKLKSNGFID